jgi:integrase/recombinase XerD
MKGRRGGRQRSVQSLLNVQRAAPDSLRATMAAYLESMVVLGLSAATQASRASTLLRLARWCEERGISRPTEVTRPLLERYQRHLFYFRSEAGRPLSVVSQAHQLVGVRQYFKWCSRQALLPANPASELQLPKVGLRLPRYTLTVAEVEAVLAQPKVGTLEGLRDRALLEVLWATGVRRSEAAKLSVYDVRGDGTLFVRQGKGKKDRVVPISQRALEWLRRYLEEVRPRLVVPPDAGLLFLGAGGQPLPDLSQLVGGYVKESGLPVTGACHLFRHACATAMLEGGADIRFVQELLGHAKLDTTQVYTRVTITKLKAVYAATHPGARGDGAAAGEGVAAEVLRALEEEDDE